MSKRIRYYSEKTVKRIISWVCPGTYFTEDIVDRIKRAKHISIPDKHGQIVDGDKVLECLASILEKHDYIMVRDNLIKSVPILLEASE